MEWIILFWVFVVCWFCSNCLDWFIWGDFIDCNELVFLFFYFVNNCVYCWLCIGCNFVGLEKLNLDWLDYLVVFFMGLRWMKYCGGKFVKILKSKVCGFFVLIWLCLVFEMVVVVKGLVLLFNVILMFGFVFVCCY